MAALWQLLTMWLPWRLYGSGWVSAALCGSCWRLRQAATQPVQADDIVAVCGTCHQLSRPVAGSLRLVGTALRPMIGLGWHDAQSMWHWLCWAQCSCDDVG
jgi:hypothetical protein